MSDNLVLLESPSYKRVLKRPQVSARPFWQRRLLYAIGLATLAGFALVAHYFTPLSWNVEATRTLQSLKAPGLHELMRLISGFGNAPKVIAITVVALLACNKRREAFWLTLSGLGGWFVSMQLKQVFVATRPTADVVAVFHQWPNGSFPSGHLVFYICYFGFLLFIAREELPAGSLVRRLVLILLSFPIALVGFSRVYLGEHWTSDLPGSYLLGGVWLALSLKLYCGWTRSRRRQHDWFLPYRTLDR